MECIRKQSPVWYPWACVSSSSVLMSKNTWLGQESDPSFFVYTRYSVSVVHRHIASSWRIWQALWHPFWRKKKTEKEDQTVVNVLISVHSMLDLILLSSKRYFKQEMKPFVVMEVRYWCSQTEVFWISWQQWSDATMQASNLWYYFSFMCWAVCDAIPLCLIVDAGFIQHGRMETLISHFKPSSSVTVGWRFVVNMSSHMMWHFFTMYGEETGIHFVLETYQSQIVRMW